MVVIVNGSVASLAIECLFFLKNASFIYLVKVVLGAALIFARVPQSSTSAPYPAFKSSRIHTHPQGLPQPPLPSGSVLHASVALCSS